MWRHYVYQHRRRDTGEIFYVGKGTLREGENIYWRADGDHNNIAWRRIVTKSGKPIVEILAHSLTDAAAQALEMSLIAKIGRRNLKAGPLVNFTNGGDGHHGLIASAALRAKRSANAKLPRSAAWIASMRAARKKTGNCGLVKKGDTLPDWWRQRISIGMIGNKNGQRVKVTHAT